MAEILRKVTPFEYNYICDKCNNGMMKATGEKNSDGAFEHKCMICSHTDYLTKSYPHIEYFGEGEEPKIEQ